MLVRLILQLMHVSYDSLLKTLERYQRYIYASADAAVPSSDEMQV